MCIILYTMYSSIVEGYAMTCDVYLAWVKMIILVNIIFF